MADSAELPFDINKAAADIGQALKDGAYVAIGLGVLGFQRAQVQRVELTKQLEGWLDQWGGPDDARSAGDRARATRSELAGQLSDLAERVDGALAPARDLGRQFIGNPAREAHLDTARTQLTQLARAIDERVQPVRQQFDEQFDLFEQYLPAAARSVVHSVRAAAAEPEQRLRSVVGLD
jgi:hypothetical protein